jgi:2-polyprenyl-3-methyl-5-hydroxy-6-metoxy-1,4-benzoquinol methylase
MKRMSGTGPSGTEGYAGEAEALFRQYESICFAAVHGHIMPLMPRPPARVLDIGAGTGRDAAGLAELGYLVTAVEPTAELRTRAQQLHVSPRITWLDDSLPDLCIIAASGETFDVVMLTAVWMHLDATQRRHAMPAVAALVRPSGLMTLSLRHGPVPAGRRMFEVTAEETIALAQTEGLTCIQRLEGGDSLFNRSDIRWDRLAFRR